MIDLSHPLTPWTQDECVGILKAQIDANQSVDPRIAARNAEIIALVAAGLNYVRVAAELDLTPAVVEGVIRRHAPELIGRYRRRKVAA